jgi:hypothetical protein
VYDRLSQCTEIVSFIRKMWLRVLQLRQLVGSCMLVHENDVMNNSYRLHLGQCRCGFWSGRCPRAVCYDLPSLRTLLSFVFDSFEQVQPAIIFAVDAVVSVF